MKTGGGACELVNATVVPNGSRAQQANGSCFALFRSPWPRGVDLARGKAVMVPGAWDDYAEKQTVVSPGREPLTPGSLPDFFIVQKEEEEEKEEICHTQTILSKDSVLHFILAKPSCPVGDGALSR